MTNCVYIHLLSTVLLLFGEIQLFLSVYIRNCIVINNKFLTLTFCRLTGENKRLGFGKKSNRTPTSESNQSSSTTLGELDSSKMKEKIEQMEKDIYRFINRIAELEKEKESLAKEIERRKTLESIKKETVVSSLLSKFNPQTATISELRDRVQELSKENGTYN